MMPVMNGHIILDVIDACYRVDLAEDPWLHGIAVAAAPLFDDGLGVAVSLYDARSSETLTTNIALTDRFDPEWLGRFQHRLGLDENMIGQAPVHFSQWIDRSVGTVRSIPELAAMATALGELGGASDMLAVHGRDPTGFGVWLGAPKRTLHTIGPHQVLFERLAVHLAAAYRIRRRLAGLAGEVEPPEAIITTDGRIEHAAPAASAPEDRRALRQAVVDYVAVHGPRGKDDPGWATQAWKGLTSARWTLLDSFEEGPQQFIVARRNDVAVRGVDALSERERQVLAFASLGRTNKEIAYDLGLSMATVRVLMHRAAQKLGVKQRNDAIAAFQQHGRT